MEAPDKIFWCNVVPSTVTLGGAIILTGEPWGSRSIVGDTALIRNHGNDDACVLRKSFQTVRGVV